MKKFLAIPLLVLYLVAVSGMMVQIHFCGSELSSWNVNNKKAACCCGDSNDKQDVGFASLKEKSDDCCKDKTITLKIAQDQNRVSDMQLQLQTLQLLPATAPSYLYVVKEISLSPATQAYQANAPPGLWQDIPLYKLHSRFTYYG